VTFFLFPKIKEVLEGRHFDDIRSNTTAALKATPQNHFQNCFERWTRRWHWCIASQGEYSDPFRSNFSATHILPSSYLLWVEEGGLLVIILVLKEKNSAT
jgi:hypothetical protein